MAHGPAVKLGKDNASAYKTKLGVSMFVAYTIVIAVIIVVIAPIVSLITRIPVIVTTIFCVYSISREYIIIKFVIL